jgi:hypothetical protein
LYFGVKCGSTGIDEGSCFATPVFSSHAACAGQRRNAL